MDEARAVYKRACEIHLTYKPNIHMQWATFEERHGTNTLYEPSFEMLNVSNRSFPAYIWSFFRL